MPVARVSGSESESAALRLAGEVRKKSLLPGPLGRPPSRAGRVTPRLSEGSESGESTGQPGSLAVSRLPLPAAAAPVRLTRPSHGDRDSVTDSESAVTLAAAVTT